MTNRDLLELMLSDDSPTWEYIIQCRVPGTGRRRDRKLPFHSYFRRKFQISGCGKCSIMKISVNPLNHEVNLSNT
jgi:hypothetical protein